MNSQNLEDHIDDPIKKVVAGLALLRFIPLMSCCGFSYDGEKVKKKHNYNRPYVYLEYLNMPPANKALLIDLIQMSGWNMTGFGEGQKFVDLSGPTWRVAMPLGWDEKDSPHQHESPNLIIQRMEFYLSRYKQSFLPEVEIVDGNKWYKEELKLKYWQYKPTNPWKVTPEIFDLL